MGNSDPLPKKKNETTFNHNRHATIEFPSICNAKPQIYQLVTHKPYKHFLRAYKSTAYAQLVAQLSGLKHKRKGVTITLQAQTHPVRFFIGARELKAMGAQAGALHTVTENGSGDCASLTRRPSTAVERASHMGHMGNISTLSLQCTA